MVIPISMLWGTQMKMKRKITFGIIFSLAVITIIFAIVRTTVVSSLTRMPDTSWLYMWSAIETTIGKFSLRNTQFNNYQSNIKFPISNRSCLPCLHPRSLLQGRRNQTFQIYPTKILRDLSTQRRQKKQNERDA